MTNFEVLFHTTLKYEQHHAILLLKRFHQNSYNNLWVSFRVKGQHFIQSKQHQVKVLPQRSHLNGCTIGFYPNTSKLDTALINFLKIVAYVLMRTPKEKPPTPLARGSELSPSHFFKQKGYHEESFILQVLQLRWVFCLDSLLTLSLL